MNAVEVIARRGYNSTRKMMDMYVGLTPTHGKYMSFNSEGKCTGILNTGTYGDPHCEHIERALRHVELVTRLGGVAKASKSFVKHQHDRACCRYYLDCSPVELESAIHTVEKIIEERKLINGRIQNSPRDYSGLL